MSTTSCGRRCRFQGRSSQETQGSTSASLQSLEIDAAEISIMRRPDGSEWKLGEGAFGSVRLPTPQFQAVTAALKHGCMAATAPDQ